MSDNGETIKEEKENATEVNDGQKDEVENVETKQEEVTEESEVQGSGDQVEAEEAEAEPETNETPATEIAEGETVEGEADEAKTEPTEGDAAGAEDEEKIGEEVGETLAEGEQPEDVTEGAETAEGVEATEGEDAAEGAGATEGAEAVEGVTAAEGAEPLTEGEAGDEEGAEKPTEGEDGASVAPEGEEGTTEAPIEEGEEGTSVPVKGEEGTEEIEGVTEEPTEDQEGHLEAIVEGADDDEETAAGKQQLDAVFDEEEGRPESGLRVGERLNEGEEASVEGEAHDRPELMGSPHEDYPPGEEQMDDEYDEEEEEEEEEIYFDREALEKNYKQAIADRKQLLEQNSILQNKLAEYFRKKKADSEAAGGGKMEVEKSSSEYEQRYIKYLSSLEDLKRQYFHLQDEYQHESEDLKLQSQEKEELVDSERLRFMEYKKQIGLKAVNSRSGRSIQPKDLDVLLSNEQKKEADVLAVRLENIKLQNRLIKEEMALKSKEELAEGLHLIDFEQLKVENQTYNEKIEDRNEELLKLRKKITSTVQVLTHLKEKLQFVKQENQTQRTGLAEVDAVLAKRRDLLSRTKQQRDSLRLDNNKLNQNCGMLGNEMLLRDMEMCVDKVEDRKTFLERMRMEHAELTLKTNGLRRKIEQSKSTEPLGLH